MQVLEFDQTHSWPGRRVVITAQKTDNDSRIIVALDYAGLAPVEALVTRLDPGLCKLKVGKQLFTSAGPEVVRYLTGLGFQVFLDLKFHDIPHTVARACEAAADLGVWMLNVHALGGALMLQAAREALGSGRQRPLLIAVTILTSHDQAGLAQIGLQGSVDSNVDRLARLALQAGLDGVVCSAREAARLRQVTREDFVLVTPGIRPLPEDGGQVKADDQKRIMTPAQAIHSGSDYLVVGRPVTQAQDPLAALTHIDAQVRTALRTPS